MNPRRAIAMLALTGMLIAGAARAEDPAAPMAAKPAASKPVIEVCFALDTTGSMGGLIAGAKRKIWSIANEIVALRPTPTVRIALVGYRDRADEYVTRHVALTDDLDLIYEKLMEFQANGGGDTPESVNQALAEAVEKTAWSDDPKALRIVFLVGDAPPHMDYPDDVKYQKTCALAAERGIYVNTIQCGNIAGTKDVWQEIAQLSEGSFAAIPQSGNMVVMRAPMDEELAKLNVAIGKTILACGTAAQQFGVWKKQGLSEDADGATAADRLAYNGATRCVVQGGGDLIDEIDAGRLKLDDIETEKLPEAMREMTAEQRVAHVAKIREERSEIRQRIEVLLAKRKVYIEAETKRLRAEGKGDAFDREVADMLTVQAGRKGLAPAR